MMTKNIYDILRNSRVCKIVIAGNGAVGKTTISQRLSGTLKEEEERLMTCGIDFHNMKIMDANPLTGEIWDLGGQEQFRTFQGSFFKGVQVAIFVYSVEWIHSFLQLDDWIEMIEHEEPKKLYLIANKIDADNRAVSTEEGQEYALKHNMAYYEISALKGRGFEDFKEDLIETLLSLYEEKSLSEQEEPNSSIFSPNKTNTQKIEAHSKMINAQSSISTPQQTVAMNNIADTEKITSESEIPISSQQSEHTEKEILPISFDINSTPSAQIIPVKKLEKFSPSRLTPPPSYLLKSSENRAKSQSNQKPPESHLISTSESPSPPKTSIPPKYIPPLNSSKTPAQSPQKPPRSSQKPFSQSKIPNKSLYSPKSSQIPKFTPIPKLNQDHSDKTQVNKSSNNDLFRVLKEKYSDENGEY